MYNKDTNTTHLFFKQAAPPSKKNITIKKVLVWITLILGIAYSMKTLFFDNKVESSEKTKTLPFMKDYLRAKYKEMLGKIDNMNDAKYTLEKNDFNLDRDETTIEFKKVYKTAYLSRIEESFKVVIILKENGKKKTFSFTVDVY